MLQLVLVKNDLKQIMRDPIMVILMIAPLFLIIVFKLLISILPPLLLSRFGFDLTIYMYYIFVFVLIVGASILGIVTGFMMIDERDGKIAELMSVTPLGRYGYLLNRILFAASLSVLYGVIAYYVLNVVELPFFTILFLSFLSSCYSIIIGLLIYALADDKVKALTYAKAINSLGLFAFSDLLALKWLSVLSWFIPPYWITLIVKSPDSLSIYALAIIVNFGWFFFLVYKYIKKEQ